MGAGQLWPPVPVGTFPCWWGGPMSQAARRPDTGCLLLLTLAELASSHVDFGLPVFPTHPDRPRWNILEHTLSLETLPLGNSTWPRTQLPPTLTFSIPLRRGLEVSEGAGCDPSVLLSEPVVETSESCEPGQGLLP